MARILVIDDDKSVRAAIKLLLEHEGHGVVVAEDGHAGLRMLESDKFDLLIVDVFMPGMDGIETIRAVRNSKPTMPIIVMSGSSFRRASTSAPDFLTMATKFGAIRSIQKPFKPRELSEAISAGLAAGKSNNDGRLV